MWGNNASGNLVIPSQVIADGGVMNMVGILSGAFYQDTGLTSLTVPNTVHYIESGAFFFCSNLDTVIFQDSSYISPTCVLSYIGDSAFYGCGLSDTLTIPKSVTYVGKGAFADCSRLNVVNFNADSCTTMGGGLEYIGGRWRDGHVFRGCPNLTTLNIGPNVR